MAKFIKFLLYRLIKGIGVILGIAVVIFFLFFTLPGDPVSVINPKGDSLSRANTIKELGLDKPLLVQLGYYLNDLSPVSFHENTPEMESTYNYFVAIPLGGSAILIKYPYLRRSYENKRPVAEILWQDLGGTLVLAITSMVLATLIGVFFGIIAALRHNTWVDYSLVTISILGISIPSFVMAIGISLLFGHYLKDYTGLAMTGSLWGKADIFTGRSSIMISNLILPAFTLALRPLSIIVQLTRSSMLEVLSQDYIRTAKAKGLSFFMVIYKHALRNALNPLITTVSGWLASLMAGAFFIEYVFNWKGIGATTINAVGQKDLPIVMGATLLIGVIFVVVNAFVDILYSVIDPRIQIEE
ncbi:ABC transporter permease [Eisenibacter elegans]|uniref:ABC transporter permease n=1 Tax=Eisenibacter elegans TaxID=997 RepID=UPI0003F79C70|nr:ABC transporter permease [Eisenibacter elegans]